MYIHYSSSSNAETRATIRATLEAFVLPGQEGTTPEAVVEDELLLEAPAEPVQPKVSREPLSEALRLDLSTSAAVLEHAGYDVDIQAAETGEFRAMIQRDFTDIDSFIGFARAAAMPAPRPIVTPQRQDTSRPVSPAVSSRLVAKQSAGRTVPVLLIVLAIVAVILLLVYPWQQ